MTRIDRSADDAAADPRETGPQGLQAAVLPGEGSSPGTSDSPDRTLPAELLDLNAPVRILVVDDESTLRAVIGQVLGEDGHEVTEAPNAEEALALFRKTPFPLVITDIVMGRMSGLDLLNEIKLIEPDSLVVVMTSHASIEATTTALRAGAYDFLIKPFEDLSLISAVANRAAERVRLQQHNRSLIDRLKKNAEELELLNQSLRDMVNRDGLTGLFNHRYLLETLEVEISRSQRHGRHFSLLFLDVDHFKQYNDTHGHLAGDEVLRVLGKILRDANRASSVCARYGGEEFVILVPEADREGAKVLSERLRWCVEEYPFAGRTAQPLGRVTVSLGIACFPEDGADVRSLISAADQRLYRAKQTGRNRVVS